MSETSVLYVAGKEIGETIAAVQNATDDGKIRFGEWLEIGKEGGEFLITAIKNFVALKDSVMNGLSSDERAYLVSGLKDGYDITNDATEETIEIMADCVVNVVGEIGVLIEAAKALK